MRECIFCGRAGGDDARQLKRCSVACKVLRETSPGRDAGVMGMLDIHACIVIAGAYTTAWKSGSAKGGGHWSGLFEDCWAHTFEGYEGNTRLLDRCSSATVQSFTTMRSVQTKPKAEVAVKPKRAANEVMHEVVPTPQKVSVPKARVHQTRPF